MGGGIGKLIIEKVKAGLAGVQIMAVGTNSAATAAMLKAGADCGATGENAVVYNAAHADCIVGALGIAFANAMYGEVSPKMAEAVSHSPAHKLLIPIEKCNVTIVGVAAAPVQVYVDEVVAKLRGLCGA
jgi:N-acetylglutamate synthase/N-acetylornithine aminotransferase